MSENTDDVNDFILQRLVIEEQEQRIRELEALLSAVNPNDEGPIYIVHMDYDEWLERRSAALQSIGGG